VLFTLENNRKIEVSVRPAGHFLSFDPCPFTKILQWRHHKGAGEIPEGIFRGKNVKEKNWGVFLD